LSAQRKLRTAQTGRPQTFKERRKRTAYRPGEQNGRATRTAGNLSTGTISENQVSESRRKRGVRTGRGDSATELSGIGGRSARRQGKDERINKNSFFKGDHCESPLEPQGRSELKHYAKRQKKKRREVTRTSSQEKDQYKHHQG